MSVFQVLMVPQLTLLAAGIYPWPVLLKLVETAVAAARQVLVSKVCPDTVGGGGCWPDLCKLAQQQYMTCYQAVACDRQ